MPYIILILIKNMETEISPVFQKWLKACLKEEFAKSVEKWLEKEEDGFDIAQKVINSKKMTDFIETIKIAFAEQRANSRSISASTMRPQTPLSFAGSDFSEDEWSILKGNGDQFGQIVDRINLNKPVHVRLAGYETLLSSDLGTVYNSSSWEALLKTLRDGITDENRAVFEASLQVHAKLLGCYYPVNEKSYEVYGNLLTAFNSLYHFRKLHEVLPTTNSGINFKIFLHEKLCRMMHLTIRHQEEILKGARNMDKNIEEMIEQFLAFLSCNTSGGVMQAKVINTLNIVSILEPQAGWSQKWNHSLMTRKILTNSLSKSPTLLKRMITCVTKGLEEPPTGMSLLISDDVNETYISGESIDTLTYLHSLNFLAQLYSHSIGRALLSESQAENVLSVTEFLIGLLNSLNVLASSDASNGVYEISRNALKYILEKPIVLCDARFYHVALNPAMRTTDIKIWPHMLDVLMHMLNTADGCMFLVSEYRTGSANLNKTSSSYPAVSILTYTSSLLKQPLSVMNVEHIAVLFRFVGGMFEINRIYSIVQDTMKKQFFPAIKYFYEKMDKNFVENETKTQQLDSATKAMLLKVATVPLALQSLAAESVVFHELIRGFIAPLRASWTAYDIVGFVSNAAFTTSGIKMLQSLAPHVLHTVIIELCKLSENQFIFHDPWDNHNVRTFQHILALFSLNTKCFTAFMVSRKEGNSDDEDDYPVSLHELFLHSLQFDSPYHYLGLLSLKETIWNLDIYIYLLNLLDFQDEFLKMQGYCLFETEDDDGDLKEDYVIDECSLKRHEILLDSYFIHYKHYESDYNLEDRILFSKMPPPRESDYFTPRSETDSELRELLEENRPGLRDSNWVSQVRTAFKNSVNLIENSVVITLLSQMQEAIPTADWVDQFKWKADKPSSEGYWLFEEILGFDVVVNYAEVNHLPLANEEPKYNLKMFIQSTYEFINYIKPENFEHFDWFLSSVFIICNGELMKCKTFISQIIKFPSAMFMWTAFGKAVDKSNNEEVATQFLFAQLLEDIVCHEFSSAIYALKRNCGVSWWMICNRLISQCFWGLLPWNEIINYIVICILYPPDYMLYYCASLLNHCQEDLLQSIANGKMWPEYMSLHDYRCNNQIGYMDRLGKRYRGKILPILTQRKFNFPGGEIESS